MASRTLNAVLRRLDDAKEVCEGDRALEFWRDVESGELRLRDRAQRRIVAVDEHQFELTLVGLGEPMTAAAVSSLLCRVYDEPQRYFGARVVTERRRPRRTSSGRAGDADDT